MLIIKLIRLINDLTFDLFDICNLYITLAPFHWHSSPQYMGLVVVDLMLIKDVNTRMVVKHLLIGGSIFFERFLIYWSLDWFVRTFFTFQWKLTSFFISKVKCFKCLHTLNHHHHHRHCQLVMRVHRWFHWYWANISIGLFVTTTKRPLETLDFVPLLINVKGTPSYKLYDDDDDDDDEVFKRDCSSSIK